MGSFKRLHELRQSMFARVIAAIRDDNQSFLVALRKLEVIEAVDNRVVKNRAPFGRVHGQPHAEQIDVARKSNVLRERRQYPVIEIEDKDLVLRIAGVDERQASGVDV